MYECWIHGFKLHSAVHEENVGEYFNNLKCFFFAEKNEINESESIQGNVTF